MKFQINWVELIFDEETKNVIMWDKIIEPTIRTYGDMKNLYKNIDDSISDSEGLYFMYRGLYLNDQDKELFEKNDLRYDLTIIAPKIIWWEFNKTFWHFHPRKLNWEHFEEIYEVLSGSALYLQQNDQEVNYTDTFSWEKVIMKEWFWHVTINPSEDEFLAMSNIVETNFNSNYSIYKEKSWAKYYYTLNGFEKNQNYEKNSEIIEKEDFFDWWDMYGDFLINPDLFNFLK